MAEMKLTYFNGRGRAELTRLLFTQAKRSFTDCRVEGEEWTKLKPSTPKGQLPILEVDGKVLCESMAIARFVAKELGLFGSSNLEAAVCDMMIESVNDILLICVDRMFKAKTEEEKAASDEKLATGFECFEKFVAAEKKGKFILGDQVSIADVAIFVAQEFVSKSVPHFKLDHATINSIAKEFSSQSHIDEYLKARPESMF